MLHCGPTEQPTIKDRLTRYNVFACMTVEPHTKIIFSKFKYFSCGFCENIIWISFGYNHQDVELEYKCYNIINATFLIDTFYWFSYLLIFSLVIFHYKINYLIHYLKIQ